MRASLGGAFSVQPVGQLFLGRIADSDHLAGKMQFFAGQVVVEVHLDAVGVYFDHLARNHAAGLVHHRNHLSDNEQLLLELAVDFENMLGQFDDRLLVVDAVALFRADLETELVTGFMAFQALLEAGDHHVGAVDVLQRMPLGALVYYLSFYREAV